MFNYFKGRFKVWRLQRQVKPIKKISVTSSESSAFKILQLASKKTIQELKVQSDENKGEISQTFFDSLISFIEHNQNLQSLNLKSAGLNDTIFQDVVPLLKSKTNLTHVNLASNYGLNENSALQLADTLKTSSLKTLNLSSLQFEDGWNAIFEAVQKNTSLVSLIVSNVLDIPSLKDQHAEALARMLHENKTLKELNVAGHAFTDKSISLLSQSLKANQNLEQLYLDANTFGDQGWAALGDYVQQNSSLRLFSIGNEIHQKEVVTEKGVYTFLQGLRKNTHLKELRIGFKSESEEWTKELANVLKENHTLESITLKPRSTGLKQDEVDAFVQTLQVNTSLCRLHVGDLVRIEPVRGQVKPESTQTLKKLLSRNQLLKAIRENPAALPELIKKASPSILDPVFFITLLKGFSEPQLLRYNKLFSRALPSSSLMSKFKNWLGMSTSTSKIELVLDELKKQAQAGDSKSQMLLGYIYKNQLLQQSQDPEEANSYFNLATQSKDKIIVKEACFEVGHYHWMYSQNLQKSAEHFDRASQQDEQPHSETPHQAALLRDHVLLKMSGNYDVISPSQDLRQTQYQNFKNKQTTLASLKSFFKTNRTEPTPQNIKNSSDCYMTCKPK